MTDDASIKATIQIWHEIEGELCKQAREFIENLNLDVSHCQTVFEDLLEERNDRAVAITICALFDDVLLRVFQQHLDTQVPNGLDSILGPSGFLGDSHNRLKMALALHWMSKESYQNVELLQRIRNRFAHRISVNNFQHSDVVGYVSSLTVKPFDRKELKSKNKRDQFLFKSLGIFQRFVLETALWPCAIKFQVKPDKIFGDEPPKNLFHMMIATGLVADMMIEKEKESKE